MKPLLLVSFVCIWASAVPAQERKPAWQPEVEQRTREVLEGRSIVVRVYLDPQADSGRFEKVSIPVLDGLIKTSAVKSACPSISDAAVVLIWARDQTDTAVADVLGRHMYMSRHMDKSEPSLRFLCTCNDYSPQWTFLDARGEPIQRASVEVAACAYNAMGDVPLYKATLDEQGRLPRLLGGTFVFKVEHPNYGAAEVFYMHSEDDPCGIYVVPLVPRDSDAFAVAAQGDVIDSDGNPVPGARITCDELVRPDGTREYPYQRILSRGVTDAKGWFTLCLPTVTKDFELKDLPPAGTRYSVQIEPPKASNLRRLNEHRATPVTVVAGSHQTFTLQRMDSEESFHTFAFEYQEGPITSTEELKNVTLTLWRDDREWRTLAYEQWKNGCSLPTGMLRAITTRWGDHFGFAEMEVTTDSPAHLVVKAGPLTLYQGKVVDAATGEPLPGAFVLSGHRYDREDPCSLTNDLWQQLRAAADRNAMDRSPQALYQWRDRVAVADINGIWKMAFMPGFNDRLYSFTAIAPGYNRGPGFGGGFPSSADGSVEVPTIRLSPRHGQRYFPTFVFETETGPVTDPAKLKDIKIKITLPDGGTRVQEYENLVSEHQFIPGVYRAEVAWDRKYYTFEPLDLSRDRPKMVTFRPAKIEKADVTCEGRVIHGITGRPVAGAIVLLSPLTTGRDASGLTAEQWAAIGTRGPRMDPADPVLAPLMNVLVHAEIPARETTPYLTKTDSNGHFALPWELGPPSPREELIAVGQDFLGARQRLTLIVRPEGNAPGPSQLQRLEADDKGIVSLPPMKLFPAATVLVHPVLSDPGYEKPGQKIRLYWRISGDDHPLWVKDLLGTGRDNLGAGVFYQYDVQPNVTQSVYVPAGVSLDVGLQLLRPMQTPVLPVRLRNVRLEQGQVADLGRLEFKPGIQVAVKVVDAAGNPVPNVRIDCVCEDGLQWMMNVLTDAQGAATWGVPPHSAGWFRVVYYDRQVRTASEESTPYAVAGEEDAGKEFVLQLSDAFLQKLRESGEGTLSPPTMPSPASRRRQ
jgi:hypothetical protein